MSSTPQVNTRAAPSASAMSSAGSGDSSSRGSAHKKPDEHTLISLLSGGQVSLVCYTTIDQWQATYITIDQWQGTYLPI